MRVSVALATHNGERFLQDQLQSLAAQTTPPSEVVVSDDASTDGTLAIIEDFRATAPFSVEISANPVAVGFAANFLRAASLCSGDVIAFCDQDDVWMPSKLERCRGLLRGSDALLLIHRAVVATEEMVPTHARAPGFRRTSIAAPLHVDPWFLPPGNAMVFSRRLLELDHEHRPRSVTAEAAAMTHDEWIYFVATSTGRTLFYAHPLVYYRQHTANVFGAPRAASWLDHLAPRPDDYRFLSELAVERADFLEETARAKRADRGVYLRAGRHYRRIGGRLAARASIFDPRAAPRLRVARLARLAASGGYRSRRRGGLGLLSCARDCAGALLLQALTWFGAYRESRGA